MAIQSSYIPVTVIPGDGIGPEVLSAARRVVDASGAPIRWEVCDAGAKVFLQGDATGVPDQTLSSVKKNRVALKGPLETPIGFGEKSANVTLRKALELFANVRPIRSWQGVATPYSDRKLDLTVVRENVEDLYAGIEHMQTPGVAQCLKLMSRVGCERIVRTAFEVAIAEGKARVTCATKANIMKLTEGLLKEVFFEVAKEYPSISADHVLVDNCAHQLVRNPEAYQVIVTSNMNGDILSDLTSGLVGGLGFAPGANLGNVAAIFEAVHGTAPSIAGKNLANPTAAILSACMMLDHLGLEEHAWRIRTAIESTLSRGVVTCEVDPQHFATTTQFTDAVIEELQTQVLPEPQKQERTKQGQTKRAVQLPMVSEARDFVRAKERRVCGVDIFVESNLSPVDLGDWLSAIARSGSLELKMISNRGTCVYPSNGYQTACVDHYRCRFMVRGPSESLDDHALFDLLKTIGSTHRWMHIEKLQIFDGKDGFSRAQGEHRNNPASHESASSDKEPASPSLTASQHPTNIHVAN